MRTVFHLDDDGSAEHVLANVENLLGDDSVVMDAVAVVANADGVAALTVAGGHADRVATLAGERGIDFYACQNSMRRREVTAGDLVEGVEPVPSGVGALTRLQHQDYAYVKG